MMKFKVAMSVLLLALAGCSMDEGGVQADDNQRPCPECPECDVCPSDQQPANDPCNGVSFEGQCTEDGVVQWCEDGELQEIDCVAQSDVCGFDEELQFFDCLVEEEEPVPEPADPTMDFSCTCGHILLDVQFELGEDGCIRGVLGHVLPSDVKKVNFFIDEQDVADSPSSEYVVESNSATLELPGCSVTGNMFLELRGGGQAWMDLGDTGHWQVTGASVSGNYLVASCGQGSECYCQ